MPQTISKIKDDLKVVLPTVLFGTSASVWNIVIKTDFLYDKA